MEKINSSLAKTASISDALQKMKEVAVANEANDEEKSNTNTNTNTNTNNNNNIKSTAYSNNAELAEDIQNVIAALNILGIVQSLLPSLVP